MIGREARNELARVRRQFFVRLGIFFLPDASISEKHSLVELHGRGDGELEAQVSPRDEAKDRRLAAEKLGRSHRCRFLVAPLQEKDRGIADELEALHLLEVVLHNGGIHPVIIEGGFIRSFCELAESHGRLLLEHLIPNIHGDALKTLGEQREEELVAVSQRVQAIHDVRLEHLKREREKKLGIRSLVWNDVSPCPCRCWPSQRAQNTAP